MSQKPDISKRTLMQQSITVCLALLMLSLPAASCLAGSFTVAFAYDNLGRLVKADYGTQGVVNYSYDAGGNLTIMNSIGQGASTCCREAVTLSGFDFTGGETTISSESAITVSGDVTVKAGTTLNLKAPRVDIEPGFQAEPDSVFKTKSLDVNCQ